MDLDDLDDLDGLDGPLMPTSPAHLTPETVIPVRSKEPLNSTNGLIPRITTVSFVIL